MGILYEISLIEFIFITVILGGLGAFLTGRAIALTWRPEWTLLWFTLLLTSAIRFIHFALFEGTLLMLHYFIVDFVVLLAITYAGYRIIRTNQMVTQYSWVYEKAGPFFWRKKTQ